MNYSIEQILFIGALLAIAAIFASKISERFGVPALLLFLGIGMLAGSEGPGGIFFENIALSKFVGIIALVFILFYGGLDTRWSSIKSVMKEGIAVATIGVIITAGTLGILIYFFLKLPFMQSLLLGAIISSTDAAAVFSILRSKGISLKGRIRPLLEFDSASNDPMAVFLTMTLIRLMTAKGVSVPSLLPELLLQMGVGFLAGVLGGRLVIFIINKINLYYEGLYPVLVVTMALFIYAGTTYIKGSGFLAVYIAGLVVGNGRMIHKRNIVRFNESIAWFMQIVMFIVLGLLVYPSRLLPVMGQGAVAALLLMFVARPLSIFINLSFSGYTVREKLMISWVGLLGAVPIILATFPLAAGVEGGEMIFNMVFFVVLLSALFQGSTIAFVAKLLKVNAPLSEQRKYPLEFEQMAGIDADLNEVIIPFGSDVAGKRVFELGVPQGCVITMISRGENFIIPNGTTVLEEGDVMLVMAEKEAVKQLEAGVAKQKEAVKGNS
ncbi:MAG: potassium/proton antiporter [Spirochaetia bacterium]|nr:potassium/proton antiporter [Spirochaetia bacterium]